MRQSLFIFAVNFCRLLLATTFLFSGFVKAVDPIGMSTTLNSFFRAWSIHSLDEYGLLLNVLSITLGVAEFMLGVYLFLGMRRKFTTVTCSLFLLFMTGLTIYMYIYNPVSDCGCFGEAFPLTNGETLIKNIVLFTISLVTLFFPQHIRRFISERNQWITSVVSFIYILTLALYSKHYLPLLDFTPYKVGIDIRASRDGEKGEKAFKDFANLWMMTRENIDVTDDFLTDSGYTFLLTSPDLKSADDGISDRINDLYDFCTDHQIQMALLTISDSTAIEDWIDRTGASYPFLFGEREQIGSMVRSNPGLILFKRGNIYRKWSSNNLPTEEELTKGFLLLSQGQREQICKLALIYFVPLFFVIFADNIWVGSKYFRRYKQRRKLRHYTNH